MHLAKLIPLGIPAGSIRPLPNFIRVNIYTTVFSGIDLFAYVEPS
jgi:hypothetical protein